MDVKLAASVLRCQNRRDAPAPAVHARSQLALHLRGRGLRDERLNVRAAQVLVARALGTAIATPVQSCTARACVILSGPTPVTEARTYLLVAGQALLFEGQTSYNLYLAFLCM